LSGKALRDLSAVFATTIAWRLTLSFSPFALIRTSPESKTSGARAMSFAITSSDFFVLCRVGPEKPHLNGETVATAAVRQEKPGVERVSYPGSKNIDSWSLISNSTIRSST